jgi:uncharacterized protein
MKPYSIITGASEGLGKAFALELAKRNHNLVLVALPSSGLPDLANFLERNFDIDVFDFETDLSTKENCIDLFNKIKEEKLQINMLINNAGMGGYYWFKEQTVEFYQLQIALNITTPTLLIKLFLDDLIKNGPSYILNVSSLSGFFSMPKKQVYAATKSYLRFFSLSLQQELKHTGVQVSVVCPGGIKSRLPIILLAKDKKGMAKWSILHPEEVASYSIEKMMSSKKLIIPGFWNRFFLLLDKLMPGFIKEKMINREIAESRTYEPLKRFKKENFENAYFFKGNKMFRPKASQPAN